MKKFLAILVLGLLIQIPLQATSKENPLKLFKKEILGADAKKMVISGRSIKKTKKVLSVVEEGEDKAVKIELDVSAKGHKGDWNNLSGRNQRWEFDTQKTHVYKKDEVIYGKYTFKLYDKSNLSGSVFQSVGTDKEGNPILPAQQIQYWDDGQVVWIMNIVDEVFYLCDDMDNSHFQKTGYRFYLGKKNDFKNYRTFSFKMKPSDTEKGETIVWLDDEKIIEAYGTNMSVGHGIGLRIGLYRWLEQKSLDAIGPTSLTIKEFAFSDECEEILDSSKCNYKSTSRQSTTTLKYKVKSRREETHGSEICKTVKGKVTPKKIKFKKVASSFSSSQGEGEFQAVVKNKTDKSILVKAKGETKKIAEKNAMKICTEKKWQQSFKDACYVHYSGEAPKY